MPVHRFQADEPAGRFVDDEAAAQFRCDPVHRPLRLFARDAILEPPDGAQRYAVAARVIVGQAIGEPHVRPLLYVGVRRKQQLEAGLEHPHDLRASLPAGHGTADDVPARAEAPLPVWVAQDGHLRQRRRTLCGRRSDPASGWRGLRLSIRIVEVAAQRDLAAHQAKEVRRDRGYPDLFRRIVLARHGDAPGSHCAYFLKHAGGAVAQVYEIRVGEREVLHVALAHVRNGEEQPLRVFVRKRPQQHGIGHAEDGRAGSDSQRDSDDGGGGKHGTLRQGPRRVCEVSE